MEFTSSEKCTTPKRTSRFSGNLQLFIKAANYYFFHNLGEYINITEISERILSYNYDIFGICNVVYT